MFTKLKLWLLEQQVKAMIEEDQSSQKPKKATVKKKAPVKKATVKKATVKKTAPKKTTKKK
jgi:topoisomerase IA-like protein